MAAVIETERLTKRYGRARGIDELSLSVATGEIFGFLGPNGAGKTTTIRTLLDLLHPTSGSARLFGLDSRRDSRAIRARVGNLPGEFSYEDRTTGGELLRLFAELRGMRGLGSAHALAERFEADLSRPLRELSRGNRQKIGLIQALFHEPELLILDEPTQGLDPLIQQVFYGMIAEARAEGRTVFLSSHVMPEIERVCDRVGIIREGRLVAVEDIGDLRAKEIRTLEIHFAMPVRPDAFEGVAGVHRAEILGDVARITVGGTMDAVVKRAADFEIVDLQSHELGLEEIFLTFYGKGDNGGE